MVDILQIFNWFEALLLFIFQSLANYWKVLSPGWKIPIHGEILLLLLHIRKIQKQEHHDTQRGSFVNPHQPKYCSNQAENTFSVEITSWGWHFFINWLTIHQLVTHYPTVQFTSTDLAIERLTRDLQLNFFLCSCCRKIQFITTPYSLNKLTFSFAIFMREKKEN